MPCSGQNNPEGRCVITTKKELKKRKAEYDKRIRELKAVRYELQCAYEAFDNITDPNMMDACIFEISALKSRYNYAVSSIRQLEECNQ